MNQECYCYANPSYSCHIVSDVLPRERVRACACVCVLGGGGEISLTFSDFAVLRKKHSECSSDTLVMPSHVFK
jgi:hypothetical protein